jgi:subtilisin family serine protease
MKRTLLAILFVACLTVSSFAGLISQASITRAQSVPNHGQRDKASADLKEKIRRGQGSDRVRVIIQPTSEGVSTLKSKVQDSGGSDVREFQNLPFRVATMSANAALNLASRSEVSHISLDREVRVLGHLSLTTGADTVRAGNGASSNRLDGTGIGIAILDSGVDTEHRSFLDRNGNLRVVMSQDFTGENRTDDPYGHGTHVASIAAGNGRISNARYIGIAPNASILNLRVLNSQGVGTTAGVLSA